MDALRQNLVYAFRLLGRSPGFTVTAIVTLALAIGANTAIFSLVNAVLIRALPYERPESLVVLWGNVVRQEIERRGASYADFVDWRERASTVEGMAAYWGTTATLRTGGEPERIEGEVVSPAYFHLLGVAPLLGRTFTEAEDRAGAATAVILGHGLWVRRFGAARDAIDSPLRLDDDLVTVVGVMPPGFVGLSGDTEVWFSTGGVLDAEAAASRGDRWFPVLARLKPGVEVPRAQNELTQIARALEQAYPETNEKRGVEVAPLDAELVGDVRPVLVVALASVGLVLLIACANIAGLTLARAERRMREMAIRTALGASRARLHQQLLTEGVLVALLAGALGVGLAAWMRDALLAVSPVALPGFARPTIDGTVLAFTLAVSAALGVALGLAPAWQLRVRGLSSALRDGSRRATGGAGQSRLRQAIVVSEVALSLVLLVSAGLLIRSFSRLTAVDPGFRPDRVLTLRVALPAPDSREPGAPVPGAGAPEAEAGAGGQSVPDRLVERVRAVPGIGAVALGSDIPLEGSASAIFYTVEDQSSMDATTVPRAYRHRVTPDFFAALGLPIVSGRTFTQAEIDREALVVLVSEGVARRFWPGEDAVGKRLKPGTANSDAPWFDVIGVVRDTRYRALPVNPTQDPDIFFPFRSGVTNFGLLVRTRTAPEAAVASVRQAIREVSPAATLYDVASMDRRVSAQLARPRFAGWLMSIFAALALFLASLGVYGVVSQTVSRRTQEIGVRLALGADRSQVVRLVLRQGLSLGAVGLGAGCVAALLLTRGLEGLLFGVTPTDASSFAAAAVLLLVVAVLATWLPARRASRVDPIVALRVE